jgi:hypothetical protein
VAVGGRKGRLEGVVTACYWYHHPDLPAHHASTECRGGAGVKRMFADSTRLGPPAGGRAPTLTKFLPLSPHRRRVQAVHHGPVPRGPHHPLPLPAGQRGGDQELSGLVPGALDRCGRSVGRRLYFRMGAGLCFTCQHLPASSSPSLSPACFKLHFPLLCSLQPAVQCPKLASPTPTPNPQPLQPLSPTPNPQPPTPDPPP